MKEFESNLKESFGEVLTRNELAAFTLRSLYSSHGFRQYKMSKFEEYDLYMRNKDFLLSDSVITFTDTDGRLLALKPDVTLSIIKNSKDSDEGAMKVYYHENVYRVSKGTRSFREIMQVGLECIGAVDREMICDVVYLAAKSLDAITDESVLEISHLDIVDGVLDGVGISEDGKKKVFACLGQKNSEGILAICSDEGISAEGAALAQRLTSVYGSAEKVLPMLDVFSVNEKSAAAVDELKALLSSLADRGVSRNVSVDFSVIGNMKYYNGLAFAGFAGGIPTAILSGGQYDNLMSRMNRRSKAIGFAVYLDELERLGN